MYLIDGHNLIGQMPDLSLTDEHDEAKLVQKLIGFSARGGKRITVVFDHGLPGGKSRLSTGTVEVIFATQGGSADAVMKQRIARAKDVGQWTVISNDHEVLAAARARKMRALTCREFAPLLQAPPSQPQPFKNKAGESMDVRVSPKEVEEWLKVFGGGEEGEK
jgi:hypothetical protein